MTIDDVIFNIYVYMDPTYDGSATFYSVPIVGIDEYRGRMDTRMNVILAAAPDGYENQRPLHRGAVQHVLGCVQAHGRKVCTVHCGLCHGKHSAADFAAAVAMWGYEANDAAELWSKIVEACSTISLTTASTKEVATAITDFLAEEIGDLERLPSSA